jgi:integrase
VRADALTERQPASPLAARPYDLRHAAVSTWLNAGVPPTQVAEWAGHAVVVVLKIYAKCIDGDTARFQAKIDMALGASSKE